MLMYPFIFAVCGLLFVFYTMYVEDRARKDPSYRAFCDFTPNISCTRGATSRWEKLFFIPNTMIGILYYSSAIILAYLDQPQFVFYLGVMGMLFGFIMMTLMISQEKIFCTMCAIGTLLSALIAYFAFVG